MLLRSVRGYDALALTCFCFLRLRSPHLENRRGLREMARRFAFLEVAVGRSQRRAGGLQAVSRWCREAWRAEPPVTGRKRMPLRQGRKKSPPCSAHVYTMKSMKKMKGSESEIRGRNVEFEDVKPARISRALPGALLLPCAHRWLRSQSLAAPPANGSQASGLQQPPAFPP